MGIDDDNAKLIFSQLDALATRMNAMETRIADLDKRTAISEIILNRVEIAFDKNVEVLSRTTDAINSIEKTMVGLQDQINMNAQVTIAIKEKVDRIESNFEQAEEKAKIDFREIVKEFFKSKISWVISGGVIFALIELIIAIVENSDKLSQLFGK